jgi:hypothetical protein
VVKRFEYYEPGIKIRVSQSRTHSLSPSAFFVPHPPLKTQATDHYDSGRMKILFSEDKAYWIKDNAVYCADIVDNQIVENSEKPLEMMFIVEKLTEGIDNDNWNSRD